MNKQLIAFALRGNPQLFSKLSNISNKLTVGKFKDSETFFQLDTKVHQKEVIIFQSLSSPVNDRLMELMFAISMMKRNGASKVHVFVTYMAYARQDRQVKNYRAMNGGDVFHFLQNAGADSIFTFDLHAIQLLNSTYNIWTENYTAASLILEIVKKEKLESPVIVSPDIGGIKRCKEVQKLLQKLLNKNIELVVVDKTRSEVNKIQKVELIKGDVKGKDCILVDDIIDTGGTMMQTMQELKKIEPNKIFVFATHGLFNGDFFTNYEKCKSAGKIYTTNSLPPKNQELEKKLGIERLCLKPIIEDIIKNNFE